LPPMVVAKAVVLVESGVLAQDRERVMSRRGIKLYLSIFSRPGLARARPAHEPYWTGVGRDLKACETFLARARPKMLFLVILQCKMRGWPAPSPSPARARPKLRPDRSHGTVMGRIFSARKTRVFSPDPNPTRPVKCLGLDQVRGHKARGSP
jgi:hypothetical protein